MTTEFENWLQTDGHQRVLLAELTYYSQGAEFKKYVSNVYYTAQPDTNDPVLSHQPYDEIILEVPEFSRALNDDLFGRATLSFGELILLNNNGALDEWLEYSWSGREIQLFLGDRTWHRDQFEIILDGVIQAHPISRSQSELIFEISDKGERLNKPLQTNTIISGPNSGKILPVCLGDFFNVTPLLVDEPTHQYQLNDGNITSTDTVRGNGLDIASFTADNSNGRFTLGNQPVGAVTCSGTGHSVGNSHAADLAEYVVTNYGGFTASEIDSASIAAVNLAAPYPMGGFWDKQINIIDVLDEICSSVGAFWDNDRFGKFVLGMLKVPNGNPVIELTEDDLVKGRLSILREISPRSQITLGYQKNHTIQTDGLAGSISESNRVLYGSEYSHAEGSDPSVLVEFPNALQPRIRGTLLKNKTDADLEVAKWLSFFSVPRRIYEIEVLAAPFTVKLGDELWLDHPRYGWSGGKSGIIVGIRQRPTKHRIVLEVLR